MDGFAHYYLIKLENRTMGSKFERGKYYDIRLIWEITKIALVAVASVNDLQRRLSF